MPNQKVFIISGAQGEGKTSRLKEVLNLIRETGKNAVGFIAEGSWEGNKRSGFTIVNIQSGESIPLCGSAVLEGWLKTGRFFFNPDAIAIGNKWLMKSDFSQTDLIVIDEIGIFELDGKIWFTLLQKLIKQNNCPIIITVREQILDRVIEKFSLKNVEVFHVGIAAHIIVEKIQRGIH